MWDGAQGKVLVVGASGQVGAAICRFLKRTGHGGMVLPAARTARAGWVRLDLAETRTAGDAAEVLRGQPLSAVLCLAGWTFVDGCEDDPERAMQVNAVGPAALAAYAWRERVPFVYYSTDYLFEGSDAVPGPYAETAATNPLNAYGRSKLEGEQRVLAAHPEALVVRTAGVYGADEQGKNYLYTVLRALSAGKVLRVPEDQVSTPAYNADLARATFALLEGGATGVYNACGPDVLGRLEFARRIAAFFGFEDGLLEGISTASLGQRAVRPLRAGLDSRKLAREFPAAEMRGVEEALEDCREALEMRIGQWREGGVESTHG